MSPRPTEERARAVRSAPDARIARLWRGEAPVLSAALLPAEWLFRMAQGSFHRLYDLGLLHQTSVELPAISVGNLAVGGSGKTPVSRWLVEELQRLGERPALLHGGYAGDEPALHARWHPEVPVLAGRDRTRSAAEAARRGATVLVLDDAFQHRRLRRDLDIVLVAAERWTRRPRLLPRGPWRESPRALRRADVVAVTRKTASSAAAAEVGRQLAELAPQASHIRFALLPAGWRAWAGTAGAGEAASARPPDGECLLVCGIADPELFLENAREAGAQPAGVMIFPDHHDFTAHDTARIRQGAPDGVVLTTAKDAVKLAAAAPDLRLWVLEQETRLEAGASELARALDRVLRAGGGRRHG